MQTPITGELVILINDKKHRLQDLDVKCGHKIKQLKNNTINRVSNSVYNINTTPTTEPHLYNDTAP